MPIRAESECVVLLMKVMKVINNDSDMGCSSMELFEQGLVRIRRQNLTFTSKFGHPSLAYRP